MRKCYTFLGWCPIKPSKKTGRQTDAYRLADRERERERTAKDNTPAAKAHYKSSECVNNNAPYRTCQTCAREVIILNKLYISHAGVIKIYIYKTRHHINHTTSHEYLPKEQLWIKEIPATLTQLGLREIEREREREREGGGRGVTELWIYWCTETLVHHSVHLLVSWPAHQETYMFLYLSTLSVVTCLLKFLYV